MDHRQWTRMIRQNILLEVTGHKKKNPNKSSNDTKQKKQMLVPSALC